MTPSRLLRDLSGQGVELWAEGDKLRYRAPNNVLTPAILADLKHHKAGLLELLRERAAPVRRHPLSQGQRALWYLYQVAPDSPAYNVAFAGRLRSEVEVPTLRESLQALVDRHATLRTTFPLSEGQPVQHVHAKREAHLELVDASGWSQEQLSARVSASYRRPFDLEQGPLMRVELFTLSPREHVLLMSLHHIVIDFWSLMVLVDELGALYQARKQGTRAELAPLTRAYSDYVDWQAELLAGPEGERLERYWKEQLSGALPALNLPVDRPRPPVQTYRGASHGFRLGPSLTRDIKALARSESATVYTVLLAAFQVLLHRYTDQQDILVGSLMAGRGQSEFAEVTGYFVNPVVLRADLSGDPTFSDFLAQVRQRVLGAMRHEDYPFPLLVERLQPNRDASLSPVFQVLFALHKPPRLEPLMELWAPAGGHASLEWAGLQLEPLAMGQQEGQFDLTLEMMETQDGLGGFFKYNTDLFDAATLRRMEEHYVALLRGVLEQPRRPISRLPLLSEDEAARLLRTWNDTRADFPTGQRIHELFEAQAARTPEAEALVDGGRRLDYRELNARANRLARHLRSLGVGPEVRVGVCVERSLELVLGLLAILKAGGTYVPLDPAYPEERLRFMIGDARTPVLLTQRKLLERLPSQTATCVCVGPDEVPGADQDDTNLGDTSRAENLAYVLYTSGSTGTPKGVSITHHSAVTLLHWARTVFTPEEYAGVLASTSICFDLSVFELFVPLSWGGKVLMAENALHLPTLEAAAEVTLINTVPSAINELLKVGRLPPSVLTVNLAGEPFSSELVRRIHRGGSVRRVYNLYGPSEDTTYSTFALLDGASQRAPTIGRPIANTQVYLLDRHLQPVPTGVAGELYLGGEGLARGYFERPALSAERFVPNPFGASPGSRLYRTGDFARHLPDGNLEFLGRQDKQVKIRGFRIELGEIEEALLAHPTLLEAVVVARNEPLGRRLVAYVVPREGQTPVPAELRRFLKERLPDHMVPATFMTLARLPLNPNGKVDARALPVPTRASDDAHAPREAPRTDAELRLAPIWSEVLRLERVSRHDNFFELGGDSILGILVVTRARRAGLQLTPQHISQHQTLAELAAVAVSTLPTAVAEQSAVTGEVPLTPIQHWYFELEPVEPHHFNQSLLLKTPPGLKQEGLARVLEHLLGHHDALRLRFTRMGTGWSQRLAAPGEPVALHRLDLGALAEDARTHAMEAAANEAQASLDLRQGPLLRAVLFDRGEGAPGRLLLAVHHLAVDAVSWRILLEDLETLFTQLGRGEALQLPPKTTSFKEWAVRLEDHARSPELARERDFWAAPRGPVPTLRPEPRTPAEANTLGASATVHVSLGAEETRALLRDVPAAHGTRINDVLLSALARSFHQAANVSPLLVALEGHGREPMGEGVDLSRTVGWFTSVFPVLLEQGRSADPVEALHAVKAQLQAIPRRGIGHGLLRFLGPDETRRQFAQGPEPELSFNYLGQLDQLLPGDAVFSVADEPKGREHGPLNRRRYLLDLVAAVRQGQLQVEWIYAPSVHSKATIERLAQAFLTALRDILRGERPVRNPETASGDFPAAALTSAELQTLRSRLQAAGTEPGDIEDIYALAPMQQGLLFHSLYAPETGIYFEQLTLRFRDGLNAGAFQRAWTQAVEDNPLLRTSFHWDALAHPVQVVHSRVELPWRELDWRGLSESERQGRMASLLEEDRQRGFALDRAPLMRCTLIRVGDEACEFLCSHHHLLMDGWSLSLLLRQVLTAYHAARQGQPTPANAVPAFRAYIDWLHRQDLPAAERYWRQTLAGFTAPTPLPSAEPARADIRRGARASHVLRLPGSRLEALAREHRLTPNTLVQGAWALMLSRYGSTQDVVWGATVSGRPAELPRIEDMVGLFINTLPLRAHVAPDAQLVPWLQDLQARLQQGSQYAYAPLAEIQRWSEVPQGTSLFESMVVFENYPMDGAVADLEILNLHDLERAHYPLALVVLPGAPLNARLSYDPTRLGVATISRMAASFETLLAALLAHPHQRVGELPAMAESERRLVVEEWNQTWTDFPRQQPIHRLVEAQVARTPEAVAVEYGERRWTYRELNGRANQLAHHLRALGVGPESMVALCVERSPEMLVAMLGILKAGGVYVPLDPSYPAERIAFMIADTRAPVLLTEERHAASLPNTGARRVRLDSDWEQVARESSENPSWDVDPEQLAYAIYTSGSTGQPKGVMVTHRAVNRLVLGARYVKLEPTDRIAQASNASFDAATFEIWGALLHGAAVVGVGRDVTLSPPEFATFLEARRISVLFLTTALFNQVIREAPRAFRLLRYVLFGGEQVNPRWVREALEQSAPGELQHVYGPTESTTFATSWRVDRVPPGATNLPIGGPISNTRAHVLDAQLQPVPIGVPGELYLGGEGLARGYLHHPEHTATRFTPDPFAKEPGGRLYRTGDRVRLSPDGAIEFLGRGDHQVKLRGFRIELGEIEATLLRHPSVREAVALVREDVPDNRRLVAYAVPHAGQVLDLADLGQFLQERLPAYMVPSALVDLPALPLTPNGKTDSRALPAPQAPSEQAGTFVAPRTRNEETLATIWAETLKLERVGVQDNFFELGGDSILSMRIVARATQAGLRLLVRDIFEHPVIEELAAVATPLHAAPEEAEASGAVPLTPIQRWFFELDLPSPHHFNQSCLLEAAGRVEVELLSGALQHLLRQHEALRLRFTRSPSGWQQHVAPPEEAVPLELLEARGGDEQAVHEAAGRLQASLSLAEGPLLRAALIRVGGTPPDRLLLVAHHLVVDSVSWQILLEDLDTAYRQLQRGEPVRLPARTTSFPHWARRLEKDGPVRVAGSAPHWLGLAGTALVPLPVDVSQEAAQDTLGTMATVSTWLTPEETHALLREAPRAYNNRINELLLAALARSFFQWTGHARVLVDLEGHGREELFDGLDLSRTVGWFTSTFPVLLEQGGLSSQGQALRQVKEALRSIPDAGIGYGVLRFLGEGVLREHLRALPRPQVSFNYLGQQARTQEDSAAFRASPATLGLEHDPNGRRPHLLSIIAVVTEGRLRVDWLYGSRVHHRSTIEARARDYLEALRGLIAHCRSPDAGGYSASDFPDANLSQSQLDLILDELEQDSTED
ncbi:non-ribosomal peptide synthetase [Corallococcus terminator]|uniref:Amino acid adenylation domain-containing protein n=1 Tax=Corallococcus terminator TaxID=2316733 RepID=A0A3A8JAJ0_9BACT|nr:non-ribosomal peptide synthetase [Corallococcus terminator]RKG92068.1 amino acid adenylation domain-containing protein [Corallococcus terminator]